MHDIRQIRENPQAFDAALQRRGLSPDASEILALDTAWRAAVTAHEAALAERNAASKAIGAAKARGDEAEFERLRARVAELKETLPALDAEAKAVEERRDMLLMSLPNAVLDSVPDGADEEANEEINRAGSPRNFSFTPLEHFEIPAAKPGFDFEAAARLSGSFSVLCALTTRSNRSASPVSSRSG